MKILVISGFLGAGKTTFIRELVRRSHREIAVFENEYGSVGVDGDALKSSSETQKVNIWEMAEGCICCSMKGDFTASVLTIANTVDPEYLVIEPTGVGMLSNVMKSLKRITYERIQLLKPLTLVDGQSFEHYRSEYTELYLDQICGAAYLAITKMEQASAEEQTRLAETLMKLNPSAELCPGHYKTAPEEWWMRLLSEQENVSGMPGTGIPQRLDVADGWKPGRQVLPLQKENGNLPDTFSIEEAYIQAPELLLLFLEKLIRGNYGDIIRAKGLLPADNCVLRFDVADGRYSVQVERSEAEKAKNPGTAVFIGRSIERQAIRRVIHQKNVIQRGKIQFGPAGKTACMFPQMK